MRTRNKLRGAAAAVTAVVVVVVAPTAAQAAHPHTVTCVGKTTLGPPIGMTVEERAHASVVTFDFTGLHDICLADGTVVASQMVGHLELVTNDDGTGLVTVDSTVSIPGGSLEGTVRTRFSPTSFDAKVRAFGGTGVLAGVTGRGTTVMTGPGTFDDVTVYKYR